MSIDGRRFFPKKIWDKLTKSEQLEKYDPDINASPNAIQSIIGLDQLIPSSEIFTSTNSGAIGERKRKVQNRREILESNKKFVEILGQINTKVINSRILTKPWDDVVLEHEEELLVTIEQLEAIAKKSRKTLIAEGHGDAGMKLAHVLEKIIEILKSDGSLYSMISEHDRKQITHRKVMSHKEMKVSGPDGETLGYRGPTGDGYVTFQEPDKLRFLNPADFISYLLKETIKRDRSAPGSWT